MVTKTRLYFAKDRYLHFIGEYGGKTSLPPTSQFLEVQNRADTTCDSQK